MRNQLFLKDSLIHENYKTEMIGGLGFKRPAPVILIELTTYQIACSRDDYWIRDAALYLVFPIRTSVM